MSNFMTVLQTNKEVTLLVECSLQNAPEVDASIFAAGRKFIPDYAAVERINGEVQSITLSGWMVPTPQDSMTRPWSCVYHASDLLKPELFWLHTLVLTIADRDDIEYPDSWRV